MFTGLIECTGDVLNIDEGSSPCLKINIPNLKSEDFCLGDSVAVNGVCLTIVEIIKDSIVINVSKETFMITNLSQLKPNSIVNIERPLSIGARIGGHIVQGHVDGVVELLDKSYDKEFVCMTFIAPSTLIEFIVDKGSVALNGVSLTIQDYNETNFKVMIIPHTLKTTNLCFLNVGDKVNIEVDILGKYIKKFMLRNRGA